MIDTKALRQLAEQATPGKWKYLFSKAFAIVIGMPGKGVAIIPNDGLSEEIEKQKVHDAQFIAATNPQTVLALLDRIDRLEDALGRQETE